jgi:hypothetical protein
MSETETGRQKRTLWGLVAASLVMLLALGVYSAKKLYELDKEVKHVLGELPIGIQPPDERVSVLYRAGVRWKAGWDQSNVWIVVDGTNEPQWSRTETNGKLTMKELPPEWHEPGKPLQ